MKIKEHINISIRAVNMLWRLGPAYFITTIITSVLGAITPYVPISFSAMLIDAMIAGAPLSQLVMYVALTVGIVFMIGVILSLLGSINGHAQNEFYRNEKWAFSDKAMSMDYEKLENRNVYALRERIRVDFQTGFNIYFLLVAFQNMTKQATSILCSVALMWSFFTMNGVSPYIKAGVIALIVFYIISSARFSKKDKENCGKLLEDNVQLNVMTRKYGEYIDDNDASKSIRLYGMADGVSEASISFYRIVQRRSLAVTKKQMVLKGPCILLEHLIKYTLYIALIIGVMGGAGTVGAIERYVACVMLLIGDLSGFFDLAYVSLMNHPYLKRYFSYFDIPSEMYQGSLTVEKRDDNEYFVEFRDVSFKYPSADSYALRHVNFKFRVGQKLAVVGMNGSGKTTFIKLMCRIYDPTEGQILLNGVDISKYDYDEYMSIFSVVFQDFTLFSYTLGQNVAAGVEYDEEKVRECLKKAGVGERLAQLPDGTETYLYKDLCDDGVIISGGEAQKIALARALYKDAPFIILDEPTAALDPVSEYEIYSKFNSIAGDKTAIYISHRLSSCKFCDTIAVFDQGSIIETGSHKELVSDEKSKYYELWHAQAQYYE